MSRIHARAVDFGQNCSCVYVLAKYGNNRKNPKATLRIVAFVDTAKAFITEARFSLINLDEIPLMLRELKSELLLTFDYDLVGCDLPDKRVKTSVFAKENRKYLPNK